MNRLIPIVYNDSTYRFEVTDDLEVVGLSFTRGKHCGVPQPISMEDVPSEVDELLFEALRQQSRDDNR
jgi:hypothetical protein